MANCGSNANSVTIRDVNPVKSANNWVLILRSLLITQIVYFIFSSHIIAVARYRDGRSTLPNARYGRFIEPTDRCLIAPTGARNRRTSASHRSGMPRVGHEF
jgi:hypothetical protein